jgi:hypothetical protein|tara:strand:+ start:97 stop:1407 length:1311 start_codon:yes stop_codon:yes gene_type:complete
MKIIELTILLLIINVSSILGQRKTDSLQLPVQVENTITKLCCECEPYDLWVDNQNRFYNFKYLDNNKVFNVTVDKLGFWRRTYCEVNIDTISSKCMFTYKNVKEEFEKDYKFNLSEFEYYKKLKHQEYTLLRVLFEINSLNPEGYYEFLISKPIAQEIMFGDTVIREDRKKIKINLNGNLLNYYGKEIKIIEGKPLFGYPYLINEPLTYNSTTATIESSNNKNDGMYVQYFKYPNEIASVDFYEKNVQKGPFYNYYRNGNIKETGFYENGIRKIIDKWFHDGTKYLKQFYYDTISNVYKDIQLRLLDGRYILEGKQVYFTKGKVDSTVNDQGKFMSTHDNYIDSIRTLVYYDKDGFKKNKRVIKIKTISFTIDLYKGFAFFNALCEYEKKTYDITYYEKSNVVKEKGAYENYKKTGKWIYYNLESEITKEEDFPFN